MSFTVDLMAEGAFVCVRKEKRKEKKMKNQN